MKLTPQHKQECRVGGDDEYDLLEVCDSVMAVLTSNQLDVWSLVWSTITEVGSDEVDGAVEWTDGSVFQVFDIDGKLLVIVSDSGGEWISEQFAEFCENNKIEFQRKVDSLDCEGIEVDEIYTGEMDDNPVLLELLHKVYN
jgi:hypothetical protein